MGLRESLEKGAAGEGSDEAEGSPRILLSTARLALFAPGPVSGQRATGAVAQELRNAVGAGRLRGENVRPQVRRLKSLPRSELVA